MLQDCLNKIVFPSNQTVCGGHASYILHLLEDDVSHMLCGDSEEAGG
jgi:hypothetical protein